MVSDRVEISLAQIEVISTETKWRQHHVIGLQFVLFNKLHVRAEQSGAGAKSPDDRTRFQRLCIRTVGRERGQSASLQRAADREVIERLELEIAEAEQLVHRVVEEAVYTRVRDPRGLCFQVQHLPDQPEFP